MQLQLIQQEVVPAEEPTALNARKSRRPSQFDRLFAEYQAMEQDQARKAGRIGYVPHILVHASLPYREPRDDKGEPLEHWERYSGRARMVLETGRRLVETNGLDRHNQPVKELRPYGLPYGSFPRIVLAFFTSEVVLKRSPEIELGNSVREWFSRMGIPCSGGPRGTMALVKQQLTRLLHAKISIEENGAQPHVGQFLLAEGHRDGPSAWWSDTSHQFALWQPRILLSPTFFTILRDRAVPVNLRAMTALSQSPLAMDLYVWASYRADVLREKPVLVPWGALYQQFGSDCYLHKFQENFRRALSRVLVVYPELKAKAVRSGIELQAFNSSVPRLPARNTATARIASTSATN